MTLLKCRPALYWWKRTTLLLNSCRCFLWMASWVLIKMSLYNVLLIVCLLFRNSWYRILQQSYLIQRSTFCLVRACLATNPTDSPRANHPPLQLVLLWYIYFFLSQVTSLSRMISFFLTLSRAKQEFSLAFILISQFVSHPTVELKH